MEVFSKFSLWHYKNRNIVTLGTSPTSNSLKGLSGAFFVWIQTNNQFMNVEESLRSKFVVESSTNKYCLMINSMNY